MLRSLYSTTVLRLHSLHSPVLRRTAAVTVPTLLAAARPTPSPAPWSTTARTYAQRAPHIAVFEDYDIFNRGPRPRVYVQRFSDRGFYVVQGGAAPDSEAVLLRGPVVLLHGQALLWDVAQETEGVPNSAMYGCMGAWTPACLEILKVMRDRPEIILFGTGKTMLALPPPLQSLLKELGISYEVQNTRNACSTFNVLADEGRNVAACLLPLVPTPSRT
ncbi:hypothetical protein GGF31_006322 [Allomyces arbusculus]|nr:hypothetical protein GGF31_006322 [Allomyces arbusculus]